MKKMELELRFEPTARSPQVTGSSSYWKTCYTMVVGGVVALYCIDCSAQTQALRGNGGRGCCGSADFRLLSLKL